MGLDMYLNARRFIRHDEFEKKKAVAAVFPETANSAQQVEGVIVDAIYWRKANAIHNWFVRNVQDGEDNCGTYFVAREHLVELLDLCEQVLKNRSLAEELLPPISGFFFGSTAIDDGYFSDLEHTRDSIARVLEQYPEGSGWDFEYTSSW